MRIVMLGAPGSGKGTQAKSVEAAFGLPQISTGDLLRQAVADRTELGLKAKAAMDAGDLVSDDIVLGMIRERIRQDDASRGFILDGYPRNRQQAEDLAEVFGELGLKLDVAVLMDVSNEILMKRLTGRRTCSLTGRLLNIYFRRRRSSMNVSARVGSCSSAKTTTKRRSQIASMSTRVRPRR